MQFEFATWLQSAKPGDRFRYHQGAHTTGCRQTLMNAVRLAYNCGQITLVQRRTDDGQEFEYLAIRLEHPAKVQFPFVIEHV